jgi:hypothetical protein
METLRFYLEKNGGTRQFPCDALARPTGVVAAPEAQMTVIL